jgi:glycosyltransferase involved in cell wall biosynthesis
LEGIPSMVQDQNFLVLADEWGVYPTVAAHLLRPLVTANRFLWVHLMGLRAPQLNLYDLNRAAHKLLTWLKPRHADHGTNGRLALYSPPLLPFPYPMIRAWNRRAVKSGVRIRLAQLNLQSPILFTSLPNAAELLGAFDEQLVVYLCEDEYAEWPGVYRDYAREMEERLLAKADLTFVTSRPLVERKSRPDRPAIHLPQGVDFEHFNQFDASPPPVPADLAPFKRPIIGFAGLLNFRIDVALLTAVARAFPQASIVLIGPVRCDLDRLRDRSNVFLLGMRAYEDLPRYVVHFDVGLIPYRLTTATHYINPIKLLEYFAAGIPVVSTALPDVVAYGDVVHCGYTTDEFVAMVSHALGETSPHSRRRRVGIARSNSWRQRAEKLSTHIEQALAKR